MDARNVAAVRLASQLGMRREAHFHSSEMFKGSWSDLVIYALLDHEWHDTRLGLAPTGTLTSRDG
jgi:RimJ/RimL family protein N-acetyltransferase